MDFIMVPALFGIVTLGIYKLFELYARRRERIMLIEKLDPSQLPGFDPGKLQPSNSTTVNAMTAGCLLLGLGLGLLVGIFLSQYISHNPQYITMDQVFYQSNELIYGAPMLTFGGMGMIASVFLNRWLARKK